jgi:hypothetical protein
MEEMTDTNLCLYVPSLMFMQTGARKSSKNGRTAGDEIKDLPWIPNSMFLQRLPGQHFRDPHSSQQRNERIGFAA